MDIQSFKRNTAAIEAGQWVDDIPQMGGLRLKVRGLGCKQYQSKLTRLSRAVPKNQRLRDGSLTSETVLRIMGEAIHGTVLLDWAGITDGDGGEAVPFDDDRALKMLTDPDWRPFLDAVVWSAQVVDNEKNAAQEDLEKNSRTPSGGASKKGQAAA